MVTEFDRASEALIVGTLRRERARRRHRRRGGHRRRRHQRRHVVRRPDRRHDELPLRPPRLRRVGRRGRRRRSRSPAAVAVPTFGETFTAAPRAGLVVQRRAPAVQRRRPTWARRSWPPASPTPPTAGSARPGASARLLGRVRDIRRFGAASVDLCFVGAGRVDAYFETGLQPVGLGGRPAGGLRSRRAAGRSAPADRCGPMPCWPPRPACSTRSNASCSRPARPTSDRLGSAPEHAADAGSRGRRTGPGDGPHLVGSGRAARPARRRPRRRGWRAGTAACGPGAPAARASASARPAAGPRPPRGRCPARAARRRHRQPRGRRADRGCQNRCHRGRR